MYCVLIEEFLGVNKAFFSAIVVDDRDKLVMSADVTGETERLSAIESAVDSDAGRRVRAMRSRDVADDANWKRHRRVFKTICLYTSFGTLVRQL